MIRSRQFRFSILFFTLGSLMIMGATAPALAGTVQPLLYVDDSAGRLGTVNLSTGEVNVIGDMGVTLFDIAFDRDGKLFGVNPDGLWSVDPSTAETKYIGGTNFSGTTMNALVFGSDGTLYSAGRDSTLYTVDPTTGAATAVGNMGYSSAGDLAFDQQGRLFLSSTNNSLVQIDPGTGAGTELGAFGFGNVFGIARDSTGIMYGYSEQNIFSIDLLTGAGTLLQNYAGSGLSQAYGGSFRTEAIVPEPATAALALLGISGVMAMAASLRRLRPRRTAS